MVSGSAASASTFNFLVGLTSSSALSPVAAGAGTSANSTIVNDNRMNVDQSAVKNESYGGSSSSEIATEVKAVGN